jgi:hypothetical protein
MPENTSRRAFLGAATTAATAALAGCLGGGEQPPLEPQVPASALEEDGWRHVDDIEQRTREPVQLGPVEQTVEIRARGKVYANPRPIQRVRQQLGLENPPFQPPPAQFFAMKMQTDPPVHRLTGVSNTLNEQLLDQAESQAMSEFGGERIQNLRRVDQGELDIEAAGTAVHRRYRGEAVYERNQTQIQGQPVVLEPGTFDIEAQLSLWSDEGLVAIAGGAYPGEPGTIDLTANGSTQTVELGLRPQQYRQSVRELTTLVS